MRRRTKTPRWVTVTTMAMVEARKTLGIKAVLWFTMNTMMDDGGVVEDEINDRMKNL